MTCATDPRVLARSLTEDPATMKLKLLTKNNKVIAEFTFVILSNTLLIYIRKSIEDIGNLCEIPISISCFLLSYPSIVSLTIQSARNDCVYYS